VGLSLGIRTRATRGVVVLAVAAAAGAAAAWSCIPDLPSSAGSSDAASDAGIGDQASVDAAPPRCGDGIIQLEAGEQCDPGSGSTAATGCGADCRMQCEGGVVWPRNNHCYLDDDYADSIQGAIDKCNKIGGHVITLASEEELQAAVTAIDGGQYWVGLNAAGVQPGYDSLVNTEPGWSSICSGCYAHVPEGGTALPDTGGCVRGYVDPNRSWELVSCFADGGARHVICEREPHGSLGVACEAGVCIDLVWTWGSKRYVYVRDAALADDAEQACRAMGGTLVVLQSRDERDQLWKELFHLPTGGGATPAVIWIGLSASEDAGSDASAWTWDDDAGEGAYPPEWAQREPLGPFPRAYMYQTNTDPVLQLDVTLARNDPKSMTSKFSYVCQLPP